MSGGGPCQGTYCGILREYRKLQAIYSQNYGQVMSMNAPHANSLGHERDDVFAAMAYAAQQTNHIVVRVA